MKRAAFLTILIGLGACQAETNGGFSATGQYNVNDELGEDLAGDVDDDDTNDTTDTEDNPAAPTIDALTAELETSGDGAVLISVMYSDDQDDIEGGVVVCQFEVDEGNTRDCLGGDGSRIPIDDKYARVTEDTDGNPIVETRLSLDIDGDEYYFEITLEDAAGNQSATVGVYAE